MLQISDMLFLAWYWISIEQCFGVIYFLVGLIKDLIVLLDYVKCSNNN